MLEIEKQKIRAEIDYKKARTSEVQNKLKNIKDNSDKVEIINSHLNSLYYNLKIEDITNYDSNIKIIELIRLLEAQKSNLIR
jgi:hypothetical protein